MIDEEIATVGATDGAADARERQGRAVEAGGQGGAPDLRLGDEAVTIVLVRGELGLVGDDGGHWATDEAHGAGHQPGDRRVLGTGGVGRALGDVEQESVQ